MATETASYTDDRVWWGKSPLGQNTPGLKMLGRAQLQPGAVWLELGFCVVRYFDL